MNTIFCAYGLRDCGSVAIVDIPGIQLLPSPDLDTSMHIVYTEDGSDVCPDGWHRLPSGYYVCPDCANVFSINNN